MKEDNREVDVMKLQNIKQSDLIENKRYLVYMEQWRTYYACFYRNGIFELDYDNCSDEAKINHWYNCSQTAIGSEIIMWEDRFKQAVFVYKVI